MGNAASDVEGRGQEHMKTSSDDLFTIDKDTEDDFSVPAIGGGHKKSATAPMAVLLRKSYAGPKQQVLLSFGCTGLPDPKKGKKGVNPMVVVESATRSHQVEKAFEELGRTEVVWNCRSPRYMAFLPSFLPLGMPCHAMPCLPSLIVFLPSLLPSLLSLLPFVLSSFHAMPSLPSLIFFLPFLFPSFLPYCPFFLSPFRPFVLSSFRPSFLPSFLPSRYIASFVVDRRQTAPLRISVFHVEEASPDSDEGSLHKLHLLGSIQLSVCQVLQSPRMSLGIDLVSPNDPLCPFHIVSTGVHEDVSSPGDKNAKSSSPRIWQSSPLVDHMGELDVKDNGKVLSRAASRSLETINFAPENPEEKMRRLLDRQPLLKGWLSKKGGTKGGRRNWTERYFVLRGETLTYYLSEGSSGEGEEMKGEITLLNCAIALRQDSEDAKRHFRFCIVDKEAGISRELSAKSQDQLQLWFQTLSSAVSFAKEVSHLHEKSSSTFCFSHEGGGVVAPPDKQKSLVPPGEEAAKPVLRKQSSLLTAFKHINKSLQEKMTERSGHITISAKTLGVEQAVSKQDRSLSIKHFSVGGEGDDKHKFLHVSDSIEELPFTTMVPRLLIPIFIRRLNERDENLVGVEEDDLDMDDDDPEQEDLDEDDDFGGILIPLCNADRDSEEAPPPIIEQDTDEDAYFEKKMQEQCGSDGKRTRTRRSVSDGGLDGILDFAVTTRPARSIRGFDTAPASGYTSDDSDGLRVRSSSKRTSRMPFSRHSPSLSVDDGGGGGSPSGRSGGGRKLVSPAGAFQGKRKKKRILYPIYKQAVDDLTDPSAQVPNFKSSKAKTSKDPKLRFQAVNCHWHHMKVTDLSSQMRGAEASVEDAMDMNEDWESDVLHMQNSSRRSTAVKSGGQSDSYVLPSFLPLCVPSFRYLHSFLYLPPFLSVFLCSFLPW
jgi:hypothetical protein